MNRREKRIMHSLALHVGDDLGEIERAEVERGIRESEHIAEEAHRYRAAYRDLLVLRETRPMLESEDDLWPAVEARLAQGDFEGRPSTAVIRRIWMRPAVRVGGLAAVILLSFILGFSMRDIGGILPGASPADPAVSGGVTDAPASELARPGFGRTTRFDIEATPVEVDRLIEILPEIPGSRFPGRNLLHPVSTDTYDF